MFGYVTPCKMELKIKDYEKFKAYYCGLCKAIKAQHGNLPRMALNYDMTFLAILLDSLDDKKSCYKKSFCTVHPFKKKIIVHNNSALNYAAFCNTALTYYKLLDDVNDDKSFSSKLCSIFLKGYVTHAPKHLKRIIPIIEKNLNELNSIEKNYTNHCLDSISHPFAELTGLIISSYYDTDDYIYKDMLYDLGYNLGKWIYIIDAWDDLEKDIKHNKFNAINNIYNTSNLSFSDFANTMKDRIDFTLTTCARKCLEHLNEIPIKKNKELLYNILQYGIMDKMDKIFKRSEAIYDQSI